MNLLNEFRAFLLSQDNQSSKATVKNYLADVSQFMVWFESEFKSKFSPESVTIQIINLYRKSSGENLSVSSVERHLSSLRKFFNFLLLEGIIESNPLKIENSELKIEADPWHLKDFKNYLYVYDASKLTIKNYLIDTKQFMEWAQKVTADSSDWEIKDKNIFHKIDEALVNEYKNRLLAPRSLGEVGFSPATVNRKLSSLRKYLSWAKGEGLIDEVSSIKYHVLRRNQVLKPQSTDTKYKIQNTSYSGFPPLRLFQKTKDGLFFVSNSIFIVPVARTASAIQYLAWKMRGKPIFFSQDQLPLRPKIKNLSKELYASYAISTKYFPIHKKIWYIIRHKRPQWYKDYHAIPAVHYFHLAILIIFTSAIGFGFYQSFLEKPNSQARILAATPPQAPPQILSFQGKLTDASDNPITTATDIRFGIYSDLTSSGSSTLKWQEVNTVSPDANGIFSILLGKGTSIPQSLFGEHSSLWLGITIKQTPELVPRQQLANVPYAGNAATLQGLLPITQSGSSTSNVVLALDSSGNLSIGGTATPTFQATGGKFTLSGTVLTLKTTAGCGAINPCNVEIAPDGTSFIDLQKPLQNTSNNNNITTAVGAVEVDDLFAILATSSAQSALTINQNDTGPLISASSSAIAKFTVSNAGAGIFADDLTVNGGDLTSTATTFNLLNSTVTTLNLGGAATTINLGATSGTTTTANSLSILGNTTLGDTAADTISLTGAVNSNVLPDANNTRNLGSSALRWNTIYATNGDFTNIAGTVTGGSTTSSGWTVNSDNATANAEVSSLAFETGTGAFNSVLQWNASGDAGKISGFDNANLFNFPVGIFSQVSGANQSFTSGTLFKYAQPAAHAITQSGAFIGTDYDFSTNITVPNSSSGNQTGFKATLKDGGASATSIGFQTAGTLDYGIDFGGTIGTAEIRLSNGETISNLVDGTISLGGNINISGANTLTIAALSTAGVVHNNSSGLLSSSLITGSDLASNIAISTTGNIATTGTGTITSAGLLTASNGLTQTTGALNLTATSGSIALTGFGTTSITSTTTSGNIFTLADSSFTTDGANLANFTFTNTNAGAGAVTTNGISITPTGTTITGGGSNTLNAINLPNVTAIASNTFNALNFGTGYTDILRYNSTQIISGTGILQSAGLSGTYSNALTLSSATNSITAGTLTATGGTINGTSIGATTTSTGAFTTLSSTGATTLGNNTSTLAIDTTSWDISTLGAISGVTTLGLSGQLTSTLATGTAPLVIASTTNVANLNASSLSGATFAAPGAIGSGTPSTGAFTTLSASGAIAANGGITFDNSTDQLGAHTLGGTLDASTQIIENIGNTGTDFVATTGALTLAGVLTSNGGVTIAGGQNLALSSGTGTYTQTNAQTTDASADAMTLTLSAGGTGETGTLRGLVISQSDTAATGVFDSLAYIGNLKTPETTTNGLFIEQNAASGTLSNAIQITNTAGTLATGINFTGTFTNYIVAPNFSVSNAGALVAVGVNSGSGLLQGTGGITVTGTGNINATGTSATNIGNSTGALTLASGGTSSWTNTAGNLTISTATSGTLALTSAGALNLSAASASTVTLASSSTTALNLQSGLLDLDTTNSRVGIGTAAPTAKLEVNTGLATQIGQIIKGYTSQSADLLRITSSLDAILAKVDYLGNLTANTLTSTVAQGTAPLTVTSTTVVANLNAAAAQQPNPNLVLNSDFGRRNKWMTFMPEVFTDTSGWTSATGSLGTTASNILTAGNTGAWYDVAGLSTWKDVRVSGQFKRVENGSHQDRLLSHYTDTSNYIFALVDSTNFYIAKKLVGSETVSTQVAHGGLTLNNFYWMEIEHQGTTVIAKLYSSGASAVAKSSATLVATLSTTITDTALAVGKIGIGSDPNGSTASQWGGLSTGDGGVYVEGWGFESWNDEAVWTTKGGLAFGLDETADSGPTGQQYVWRHYIPATNRSYYTSTTKMPVKPSTTYTLSWYVKTSGKSGTDPITTVAVNEYNSAGTNTFTRTNANWVDSGETSWTRKSASFTTGSASVTARIYVMANYLQNTSVGASSGTGFVAGLQLEEGSVATPWRNAPSDDDDLIMQITDATSLALTTVANTEPAFTHNTLSANFFMPWDGQILYEIDGSWYSNNTTFRAAAITPLGGPETLVIEESADVSKYKTFHGARLNSVSAGKYRTAFQAWTDASTGQLTGNVVTTTLRLRATRGKFDLAEEYTVQDQSIEAGDVVRLARNNTNTTTETSHTRGVISSTVEKTTKGYEQNILGIISTDPAITLGARAYIDSYTPSPNLRPVALSGRVPVKVTNENGSIKRGDILTSSDKYAGYAMKATRAGRSIGIAMDDFAPQEQSTIYNLPLTNDQSATSSGQIVNNQSSIVNNVKTGKVMTFVNLSFYDPDVYLTDAGTLQINKVYPKPAEVAFISPVATSEPTTSASLSTSPIPNCGQEIDPSNFGLATSTCPKTDLMSQIESSQAANYFYAITDSLGNTVQRVGVFSEAAIGNLKAGAIDAKDIIADNLIINNKIISPIAEVNIVRTNIITPLTSDKIVIKAKEQSATTSATLGVQPLIEIQNASGSAVATIDDHGNASFSGTLNSFGLSTENASVSGTLRTKNLIADNIESQVAGIKSLIAGFSNSQASPSTQLGLQLSASESAILAYVDTLQATTGTFTQGLFAIGPSSFSDASVFGQLSVGGNLTIADNSINVLGSDLNFQSLGQGGVSFLAGKVYIDNDGNINASGNATFKGTLFANIISPIPNSDLIIRLAPSDQQLASSSGRFVVQDASGSAVLSINNKGDVTSSGSAKFSDLLAKTFSVVRNAQADTSLNETVASSSAGFATIVKGQLERTIITPYVLENSLIYLSPASDIQGMTPYISRQTVDDPNLGTKASFTIGISHIVNSDIKVNWWIVN